jgi:hypothetical protein
VSGIPAKLVDAQKDRGGSTMADFSIELAAERVVDARTRAYFKEVQRSYAVGNYRSTVVLLWSVVVCDLLFKLNELHGVYADGTAESILQAINEKRKDSPHSPEWETELLKQVKERTDLIDEPEYASLVLLHSHRHLCAHPALDSLDTLYEPTPEQTRAHLRLALDAVLTKPSVMTRKVFDALLEDLERSKALLPDNDRLVRYLDARYFSHLTPAIHAHLFRSLWRVVLRSTDERCNLNREVNARALDLFYVNREDTCLGAIEKEPEYYSDVAKTLEILGVLSSFLACHSRVYRCLTDSVKPLLESLWMNDIDAFSAAWYESSDLSAHADRVVSEIRNQDESLSETAYTEFAVVCDRNLLSAQASQAAVLAYILAKSFDAADLAFARILKPRLPILQGADFVQLLEGIETNNQTYNRGRAYEDHLLIQKRIDEVLGSSFDATVYPCFTKTVERGLSLQEQLQRVTEEYLQGKVK